MGFIYTGSRRLYRGQVQIIEPDLTKLDSKTLELAINQKIIKTDGTNKAGTGEGGTKPKKTRSKKS